MTQVCLPAAAVDAIRIALVDDCTGAKIPGLNNGYLANCFRNLTITKNMDEGDETILKNDAGRKCAQIKKCDELNNVTVEFDLLYPDYEFTNLLTGQSLINDGAENIGWYQDEELSCTPWVSLEMFEAVPDEACSAGHKYRRIVIPKIRFTIPTDEKEDPFRLPHFTGRSAPSLLSTWGDGPFGDSAIDFSAIDKKTQYVEYFDSTITDTLEGTCGFMEVPTEVGEPIITQVIVTP